VSLLQVAKATYCSTDILHCLLCRDSFHARVDALTQELQDAQKQHAEKLQKQRKDFEKEMAVSMRQVEEQAANHLATIRSDADGAQAAMKGLAAKTEELQTECALAART
jgi:hypothetical protein